MSKNIEQFPKEKLPSSMLMSQLKSLGKQYEHLHLNELFAAEPERFQKYSVHFDQLLLIIVNIA